MGNDEVDTLQRLLISFASLVRNTLIIPFILLHTLGPFNALCAPRPWHTIVISSTLVVAWYRT